MGDNTTDAIGPAPDNDGTGTVWYLFDHDGENNTPPYKRSPAITSAAAVKDIRQAAKDNDRSLFEARAENAVGSAWWGGRALTWRNRLWAANLADVAAMP